MVLGMKGDEKKMGEFGGPKEKQSSLGKERDEEV